jgi:CHAT domain-containing protein
MSFHYKNLFPFFFAMLIPFVQKAQTQESFMERISSIYVNASDTKKALEIARQLFKDTEANEDLQTYANYLMLKQVFENQAPDPHLAKLCGERSEKLLAVMTGAASQHGEPDPSNEWLNVYYPALFTTTDPENANKAEAFLEKNKTLQNFSNYNYVAYAHERNGDYEKAGENFKKALQLTTDDKKEFHSYAYYANFLARSGEFLKAEQWIMKMEKLAEEADDVFKKSYYSEALTSRLTYYLSIGDYYQYIEAATGLYDYFSRTMKFENSCDPYTMSRFTVVAHGHEMLKDYPQAEALWKKRDSAHYEWIRCHNSKFPQYKQWPLSMTPIYASKTGKMHSLPRSPDFYIGETEDHFNSYKSFSDVSISFLKASHLAFLGSSSYHENFQPILRQITGTRNFRESTLPFAQYAYFNMRDSRYEQAWDTYSQLFQLNIAWINDVIFTFGEKAFVAYYNSKLREGYDNFHSFVKVAAQRQSTLLPELSSQALNNALFTKSLSLKGTRKRKQAFLRANDPTINKMYDEWINKKQQLIRRYRQTEDPALNSDHPVSQESLKILQDEVNRLENELASRAKDFKKYLKIDAPDWRNIRSRLKEGEAAIEMVRFEWRNKVYYSDSAYYAAYIVTRDSKYPDVVYLSHPAKDLDNKLYRLYQNNIKYKLPDKDSYNNFWKPIQDALPGIKKIFFSPDGIYHLISLPTLMNPASGKYLLDEMEIRNTTSCLEIPDELKEENIETAVLFGRPFYKTGHKPDSGAQENDGTRSFVSNFRDNSIADLPGTEQEVLSIKKEMDSYQVQTELFLHEKASEEKIYKLRSPHILHIATHGYWSESGKAANDGFRLFNAMANSGLLLSGVVDYYSNKDYPDTYDGILTAYEAQNLELENTSLVILSACETSLGHMDAGEGIYGLQRAFRAAGAKSTMTSLWKVDDEATKDFMIFFYRNFLKTKNKFDAFKSAQKLLKEKYKSPFYWGPFVLSGT